MAINTLNAPDFGSSGAGWIPQIWAPELLRVLRPRIVLLKTIARDTDFSKEFTVGDTLNINYPGTLTALDKSADTPAILQKPVGAKKIPVVLNKYKYVDVEVEDILEAQAKPDVMRAYLEPMAIALANAVEADIYAELANGQGVAGTPGTGITASVFSKAAEIMDENLCPPENRHMAIAPKDWYSLLNDSTLANFFAFAMPQAIAEGRVPRIYGYDVHESQMLATVAATGTNDVQTISITGTPTGGSFSVTFGGVTSAAIAYNSTAAQVQAILQAMPSIGTGNMICTGGPFPGTAVVCTAAGNLAGKKLAVFTTTDSFTGGTSPASSVAHTTSGQSTGVAYQHDAFIIAFRRFKEIMPGTGVLSYQMHDAESGLAFRMLYGYDMANRGMRMGVEVLYGHATLRPELAVRLLT